MATGTLIFRPSQDLSFGHNPSDGNNWWGGGNEGWELISEASADDDSTYIYQTFSSSSTQTASSHFRLSTDGQLPQNAVITGFRMYSRARISGNDESASYTCYFNVTDSTSGTSITTSSSSLRSSYSTQSFTANSANLQWLNQNIDLSNPDFYLIFESRGSASGGWKAEDGYLRLTQAYIEVDYETVQVEPVLYVKEAGAWNGYNKIYVKENGVWVDRTSQAQSVFSIDGLYVKGEV